MIVVISALVFVLFKGADIKSGDKLWYMDRLCFGVYLVHPLFINFVYKFLKISPVDAGKGYPLAVVAFWTFFVVCSFAVSWLIYLIKPLKKYVL